MSTLLGRLDKGPVRVLCDEIAFPFTLALEREDIFVAFIAQLVEQVAFECFVQERITEEKPLKGVDACLRVAKGMCSLRKRPRGARIEHAVRLHELCGEHNPEGAYPTNHVIDMLSSCASAIRFGLEEEIPCRSRHAASAADHVWKQRYGIHLFDNHTPAWSKEWARSILIQAIVSLLPAAKAAP